MWIIAPLPPPPSPPFTVSNYSLPNGQLTKKTCRCRKKEYPATKNIFFQLNYLVDVEDYGMEN